jgi:hypothetical protein
MKKHLNYFTGLLALLGVMAVGTANATFVTINFSEFAVGTVISNQYAGLGVRFSPSSINGNLPIIANDGAMPGSPVLSPNPPFAGEFDMQFLRSTTFVRFDSGFWDALGTGSISVFGPGNVLLTTVTNTSLGTQQFTFTNAAGISRIVFNSVRDPAGADIDNLTFNVPEPGTLLLLGAGLLLAGFRRTSRRK